MEVTGKKIIGLKRLLNSPSGNPKWEVTFTDGMVARTGMDSSVGYVISEGYIGATATVRFNRKGEIIGLDDVEMDRKDYA